MKMRTFLLLVVLFAPRAPAQTHDYPAMKRQMQLFETLLNTALKQRFDGPFALLQEAKGSYLEGYGAVFSLEVNLYPMRLMSPFNTAPYSEKELREAKTLKLARIEETQALVRDLLRDPGPGLNFQRPEENVAVVIHLFNTGELRDLPTQIVVQAKRQALLDAAEKKLSAAEFRQKLSVVSF